MLAIAAGFFVLATSAQAQESDAVAAGRQVAKRFCGECHAIEAGAKSPLADAPHFSELYKRFPVERMAEALETGMLNDHPRMPEFKLEEDERAELTAYLKSFQPPAAAMPSRRFRPVRPVGGRGQVISRLTFFVT